VATPDADLHFEVVGDAGLLPGDVATPLAVVLNELMQNAADHAFPPVDGASSGHVVVRVVREDGVVEVDVVDDGIGLPPGFTIEGSSGLGLSIVQALVTSELGGSIALYGDDGTRVHLSIPLQTIDRPPR
jgi:two-component sensor histidine kinase